MKYDAYGNENGEQDNDCNSNLAPQLSNFVLVRFPPQRRQRTYRWLSFEISQRKKTWALDVKSSLSRFAWIQYRTRCLNFV